MAFFGLFSKKKKKGGALSKRQMDNLDSPPKGSALPHNSPPPNVVVNEKPLAMESIMDGEPIRATASDSPLGGGGGATIIKENSSQPDEAALQALRDFEERQAAIDLTRSLVKRFIADIWNRGEVDLIPEVCSPSLRFNGNTGFDRVGHEGLARMVNTIREALDDYHCEIHSMVVEHNKAFCRLRFTGKHTGNLLGYPPTGKVVAWMGATEFTCQNGRILKVWELGDIKTLEEQLTTEVEMDEV
jgi:steroid delta-isomerase-like uncharacterized protein